MSLPVQFAHVWFGKLDVIGHSLLLDSEFAPDLLVGNCSFSCDFRQCLGRLFTLDTILKLLDMLFEEFQIAHTDHGG